MPSWLFRCALSSRRDQPLGTPSPNRPARGSTMEGQATAATHGQYTPRVAGARTFIQPASPFALFQKRPQPPIGHQGQDWKLSSKTGPKQGSPAAHSCLPFRWQIAQRQTPRRQKTNQPPHPRRAPADFGAHGGYCYDRALELVHLAPLVHETAT